MNKLACAVVMLFSSLGALPVLADDVFVDGYFRSDGTYVQPHYRSAPDGNVWNNWSTIGNVNPYTGEVGTYNPYGGGSDFNNSGSLGWGNNSFGNSDPYGSGSDGSSWYE